MRSASSYLLCGTPRTGSTLLCSLLSSTGVAGHPESYFREPDHRLWAGRFGVGVTDEGDFDYVQFVRGAVRAGSTGNGVFAARIMWGSMHLLVEGLRHHIGGHGDVDVLERALGPLRFVHLERLDVVAQAVSWARAEQTGFWQEGDRSRATAELDLDQVERLVATIHEHNQAWRAWFAAEAVEPLGLTYESLVASPVGTVMRVLDFIRAAPPAGWAPVSPPERQADSLSAEWVRRYRATRRGD
ncbi:MAG: trehalose 2-sulfotransferase [Nocardioidaceae bacterium]|nr:trehalose 2-sulfotransferase [Nocardioidaceae bacterium]